MSEIETFLSSDVVKNISESSLVSHYKIILYPFRLIFSQIVFMIYYQTLGNSHLIH